MGSVLSWTLNGVLFAVGCLLAADTANEVIAAVLLAPPGEPPSARAAPPPAESRTWASRQVILERNLFDSSTLAPAQLAAESEVEDIEKSQLPVTLLGTFAATDPALSRATLRDRETNDTLVVGLGDQIKDKALVVRIERRRVVLREGGAARELTLDEADGRQPVIRRAARAPRLPLRASERGESAVRQLDEDRFAVSRADVESTIRNPQSLLSQARVLPKFEDGEMVGLQVSAIQSGSLFEEIGLQDGDVITEFNGIAIDSPSESARILQEMSQANEYHVLGRSSDGSEKEWNFVPED